MAGQIVSCPCMMSKIILSLEMQTYYWSFVLIRKTLVDEKPKPQRYAKEEESWRSEDGRAQAPKISGYAFSGILRQLLHNCYVCDTTKFYFLFLNGLKNIFGHTQILICGLEISLFVCNIRQLMQIKDCIEITWNSFMNISCLAFLTHSNNSIPL